MVFVSSCSVSCSGLQLKYGEDVVVLEKVLIVKPHRGGIAFWRMINGWLRPGSFKLLKVEYSKGRSFYVFPAEVFEDVGFPLRPWGSGKILLIYVEKGCLVIDKSCIKELNVEIRDEKDLYGFSQRKVFINGKELPLIFTYSSGEQ